MLTEAGGRCIPPTPSLLLPFRMVRPLFPHPLPSAHANRGSPLTITEDFALNYAPAPREFLHFWAFRRIPLIILQLPPFARQYRIHALPKPDLLWASHRRAAQNPGAPAADLRALLEPSAPGFVFAYPTRQLRQSACPGSEFPVPPNPLCPRLTNTSHFETAETCGIGQLGKERGELIGANRGGRMRDMDGREMAGRGVLGK